MIRHTNELYACCNETFSFEEWVYLGVTFSEVVFQIKKQNLNRLYLISFYQNMCFRQRNENFLRPDVQSCVGFNSIIVVNGSLVAGYDIEMI